jgi:glutamate 5-kinase
MNDIVPKAEGETDIAILFARDPLKISDADFLRIVQKFREQRHTFTTGGTIKAPTGKSLTKAEAETKALGLNLDLDI